MLLSQEHRQIIEERFKQVQELAKGRSKELFAILENCTEDEAICMKYLYAYMPEQDLASYNGELFLKFVRQALDVRKKVAWGEKLVGPLFFNYVLQYRINNENIEFYKEAFFNDIYPRIADLNMHDAAIETNYWCFEKATYQTTDIRTASPFTVLRNTYGRCGEESTLAVSALRSVGIPARQVYTPRWAHCDDNHAWVEVWIEGEWHYLGACEPELVLDTGWFQLPASKGMLIHNRVFSTLIENEEITYQTDTATELNLLDRYADTKRITINVKNTKGEVLQGAMVRFELINYAELFAIAELETDAAGSVNFLTGLGDLMICAHYNGAHVYGKINVREQDSLELVVPDAFIVEEASQEVTLVPPVGYPPAEEALTDEQKALHEQKHGYALSTRNAFKDTFYAGETASAFAKDYAPFEAEVAEAMEKALGNYQELEKFFKDAETAELLSYKVKMLGTLNKKDFTDVTFKELKAHLVGAMKYVAAYEEAIFVNYVLAPRIAYEMITDYRSFFETALAAEKIAFVKNPKAVYEYITNHIKEGAESQYSTLYAFPQGLFELGVGNGISRNVLFVAICRSLGIAARYNKEDGSVAYYQAGTWTTLGKDESEVLKTSQLTLVKANEAQDFDYYKNYTIAQLVNGVYVSLNLEGASVAGEKATYDVEAGRYRIITTDRAADGTIHARFYYTEVSEGKEVAVEIDLVRAQDDKQVVELEDTNLTTLEGEVTTLSVVAKNTPAIVAYLEVGAEPTEHLLNEMLDSLEKYSTIKPPIFMMLKEAKDINDPTLQKVLKVLPHIELYVRDEVVSLDGLYEAFEIHDKKLPLAYVMHESMRAKYAWAGYNVGIGELLLKYLD